jgi:VIT1/CCC1 family predicted Fe2+/Mn2+ transporter
MLPRSRPRAASIRLASPTVAGVAGRPKAGRAIGNLDAVNGKEVHAGHRSVAGGLPRAAVFGINDGLVSNVSLILGFAGSGVDSSVVRLAGLAGAVAGAISRAAGEWISVTAQNELVQREVALERRELLHNTAAETAELAGMYEEQGMTEATARSAAAEVMRRPEKAIGVHAREEMGVDPFDLPHPFGAAAISLVCFLFGAFLPLLPWLGDATGTAPAVISLAIGIVAAAGVGAAIGRFADRSIAKSVVRQVAIVVVACLVTYAIGELVGVNLG